MDNKISGSGGRAQLSKAGRRIFGIFGLVFGSLFLLVGLGVMFSALSRGFSQRGTSSWAGTTGMILEVSTSRSGAEERLSPMSYQYELEGKVYRSDRNY